jgi:PAS domain S-box-containing protein
MLRWITLARSWHLLARFGIATTAVAAATALQLRADVDVPGNPFLLYFVVAVVSASALGRVPGFLAVAESSIGALLFFEPVGSLRVTHAIDLLAIETYFVVAALSVEGFCRLVDSALTERSEANSARIQRKEAEARLANGQAQVEWARTLADSEARFRATFENAAVGIAHFDPDFRWLRANEALCRILGYRADELVTKSLEEINNPDDLRTCLAHVERMRDRKIDSFVMDKRYLRKDGSIVWTRLTNGCVRKSDGSIDYFVCMFEDISARKAHEEKEHLLMSEINHRAKNLLSVVDAIAHQTAAKSPEDFVERFSERVQALSANQDLLVRNEWNGVEIAALVRAQLAHFADLIGSRIAVHGPELRLNAASAQAIGLALHELATNAGKYGSLSTDRGRVDVSWGTDGDTLTMSWTEREGPPVSAPKRRGFGTIVMEAMAERSVDGKVDLDYAPSGLTWRLTCPAGNALDRGENSKACTRVQDGPR